MARHTRYALCVSQESARIQSTLSILSINWDSVCSALQFSKRETDIFRLLLTDHSERAVALQLQISTHTVHSHIERLYRKLGVRSRSSLIVLVFETWVRLEFAKQRRSDESSRPDSPVGW
jgi:DNA-binding CsgD family transcriptional regulator